ncbi:MAG: tRNA glutamyl-Q(34) synthetase GluQRS [Gammaproteobacteria bacterium]
MSNDRSEIYRGRFAPSPTGPLHLGSLVAAVASYLDARRQGGQWLLRMEDLDTPRVQPGAADAILRTLERFALPWDGPVLYQSQRSEAYRAAIETLRAAGHCFECACTRREIADSALPGEDGPIYPGTCRAGLASGRQGRALRVRVDATPIVFEDRLQGRQLHKLAETVGDFVILRADGIVAYQLAVVVDDAAQGITDVVRGSDLLASTPRQIHLQQLLGVPTPRYLHLPVAVNAAGEKLSKQTYAAPVDALPPQRAANAALAFLGQPVPADLQGLPLAELWAYASAHWAPAQLPRSRTQTSTFAEPAPD